jgi:hypothetical protein
LWFHSSLIQQSAVINASSPTIALLVQDSTRVVLASVRRWNIGDSNTFLVTATHTFSATGQ